MSTSIGVVRRTDPWRWVAPAALATLVIGVVAFLAWAGPGRGMGMPAMLALTPGTEEPGHTLSVVGTGRILVSPDVAVVQLGVVAREATVAAARDVGARAMDGALTAIRRAGVLDADIQTSTLSLQAVYESKPEGGTPNIVAYELRNGVTVTVRDLARIGAIIDGAVAAGATTIDGITFRVDDPTPIERQARQAAVADARARADVLVAAAGTRITGIVSISESVSAPPWPARPGAAPDAGGTPVLPGTTAVEVSVSIVYALE